MNRIFVPPIKCQGIKTKLVLWIKKIIPADFKGVWIEPFMGSGVVAFNIRPKKALLRDVNPYLIDFYNAIKRKEITSRTVRSHLKEEGKKLKNNGEEYYYEVRERFNKNHEPIDFLFLNRACFNGMIRFNSKGRFNVPFCRKPERFIAAYITKIVNQVNYIEESFQFYDYDLKCQSFEATIKEANETDIIYCDPPYIERHVDYFNGWSEKQELELNKLLNNTNARFILSTWHSNFYRKNTYLNTLWSDFNILTKEHFYHVGGYEKNRNPMLEALVINYDTEYKEDKKSEFEQLTLFEKR